MPYISNDIINIKFLQDIFKYVNQDKEINDKNLSEFYYPIKIQGNKYLVETSSIYTGRPMYRVEFNTDTIIILPNNYYCSSGKNIIYVFFINELIIPSLLKRLKNNSYCFKGKLTNKMKDYLNKNGYFYENMFFLPSHKKFPIPTFGKINYKLFDNNNLIKEYCINSSIYKIRNEIWCIPDTIMFFVISKDKLKNLKLELSISETNHSIKLIFDKCDIIFQHYGYPSHKISYMEIKDKVFFTISYLKLDKPLDNFPVVSSDNFCVSTTFQPNKITKY